MKLVSILLLGMVLLFASCNKDDDEITVDIVKKLKKYTMDANSFEFIYTNNRLSSIIYSDSVVIKYTEEFIYSGNKLMKRVFSYANGSESYYLYSNHNSYDLPTYVGSYSSSDNDTLPNDFAYYTYNGNILSEAKITRFEEKWTFDYRFTYMNDNIIRDSMYLSLDTVVGDNAIITNMEFDNMKNPGKDIGLFFDFHYLSSNPINYVNKSNIIMLRWTEPDGTVVPELSFKYIYEYDDDKYPTKCTMISFDNSMVINIKYEYY